MNYSSLKWNSFVMRWLFLSLFLHLLCAYFSVGFFHFDEHFQVLEFLNYRMGYSSADDLPYEFKAGLRGWILPGICYLIAKFWLLLGFDSPTLWATHFRVFSGLIGWLSLVGVALCSDPFFPSQKLRQWAIRGLSLFWLFPYIHARCSSDSLGGSFLFLAISYFLLAQKNHLIHPTSTWSKPNMSGWASGFLLGISFQFRYQMAFSILGFGIWCLFLNQAKIRSIFFMGASFTSTLFLGGAIDFWGYGKWLPVFWNYLTWSLTNSTILNDGAVLINVEPSYYYLALLFRSLPPTGFLIAVGVFTSWTLNPKNILTWVTAPFVLAHFVMAHKEPRYLFPMADAVPFLLVMNAPHFSKFSIEFIEGRKKLIDGIRNLLYSLNLCGLIVVCFRPSFAPVNFYYYLLNHYPQLRELYYLGENPFKLIHLPVNFYKPRQLQTIPVSKLNELEKLLRTKAQGYYLFNDRDQLPEELTLVRKFCHLEYSTLPRWLAPILDSRKIAPFICRWSLFQCQSKVQSE